METTQKYQISTKLDFCAKKIILFPDKVCTLACTIDGENNLVKNSRENKYFEKSKSKLK